jgi:energy-coupling factor transporter transmembrane protein EcfT
MLVRTHALALALALTAVLLARRRVALAAAAAAAAAAVVLPWQLWTTLATPRVPALLAGSYGSYLGWFLAGVREGGPPFVLATVKLNLAELWLLMQDRVVIGNGAFARLLAAALLLALACLGAWALSRRSAVTAWFLAIYFAIVVVWPYAPWRFLWAVWPLVLLCGAVGAHGLWKADGRRWARALAALAAAVPAFGIARTEWHAYETRAWSRPALEAGAQIAPLVAWVGRYTRPEDVVLAEGEQVISLFTGRRAAPTAPFSAQEYVAPQGVGASTTELREMLALVPARYVLPLAPVQLAAARALAGTRPGLRPVAPLPRSTVFEVTR